MQDRRRLKNLLLYALIGSVLLGAIFGIVVVLRNKWDWFEVRVILTTITVAISSLCGIAFDVTRRPEHSSLLSNGGLGLTVIAAILSLVGIWGDVESEEFWKATGTVIVICVAAVHVCLISLASLRPDFRWVFIVACVVDFVLALLVIDIIWRERGDGTIFRVVAAVSIVAGALTLVIPLLARISKTEDGVALPHKEDLAAIDDEISALRERIKYLEGLKSGANKDGDDEGHP